MNNNSWFFFEHIVKNYGNENVDFYYVLEKSRINIKKARALPRKVRGRIVWKNSIRHQALYWKADMYFVTLSYRDILPDIYRGVHRNSSPMIYLQHGTAGIKWINYTGQSYGNTLFRFMSYSREEAKILQNENGFSKYQLEYSPALPRYKELVRLEEKHKGSQNQILWFLTWREYLNDGAVDQNVFVEKVHEVISDSRLLAYLEKTNSILKVCLHDKFDTELFGTTLTPKLNERVVIQHAGQTDVIEEVAKSKFLITDYSSLGFDFTFLGKPVLIYQFDSVLYATKRQFYCDINEVFKDIAANNKNELIKQIIVKNKGLNPFFASRLEKEVDMKAVREGKYIDDLYEKFLRAQQNKVSFIGYNFYGRGGTVSATKSLAEGLAEMGYLVELICLKRNNSRLDMPNGIILRSFMGIGRSPKESAKYRLFKGKKMMSYLALDVNRSLLIPYAAFALRRFLQRTKSKTVVSTRETLHLFLDDTKNPYIENKIFYFHTPSSAVEHIYPGLMKLIKRRHIKKAAFVAEESRKGYIEDFNYKNYDQYVVTGNALQSKETIAREDIRAAGKKDIYHGITLTRISKDHKEDLSNIIDFGIFLKKRGIKNIKIDIYGAGDMVYEFCEDISRNNINDILYYKGLTETPHNEIREHDFLVDFTYHHSFGMIYIEAILNGVMCFARDNAGSREVLREVEGSVYKTNQQLLNLINKLPSITKEQLTNNYDIICDKYSRKTVASRFIKLLED